MSRQRKLTRYFGIENALDIEIDIDQERMKSLATVEDFVKYIEGFIK